MGFCNSEIWCFQDRLLLFPSALLVQQDPFLSGLRNLQYCHPQGDQKKSQARFTTTPPAMKLLKNRELKHTAYLKIVFNLYLKLQHLHFHAFPCKHKRKKKGNQETLLITSHHITLKPALQRLNPQEHWGDIKLSPFFSGSVLCSCFILLLSQGFPEPLPGPSDTFIPPYLTDRLQAQ